MLHTKKLDKRLLIYIAGLVISCSSIFLSDYFHYSLNSDIRFVTEIGAFFAAIGFLFAFGYRIAFLAEPSGAITKKYDRIFGISVLIIVLIIIIPFYCYHNYFDNKLEKNGIITKAVVTYKRINGGKGNPRIQIYFYHGNYPIYVSTSDKKIVRKYHYRDTLLIKYLPDRPHSPTRAIEPVYTNSIASVKPVQNLYNTSFSDKQLLFEKKYDNGNLKVKGEGVIVGVVNDSIRIVNNIYDLSTAERKPKGEWKEYYNTGREKEAGTYELQIPANTATVQRLLSMVQKSDTNIYIQWGSAMAIRTGIWSEYYESGNLKSQGSYYPFEFTEHYSIDDTNYVENADTWQMEAVPVHRQLSPVYLKDKHWQYFSETGELTAEEYYNNAVLIYRKENK